MQHPIRNKSAQHETCADRGAGSLLALQCQPENDGAVMTGGVYDNRECLLGEGPLWVPERDELNWFDILSDRILRCRKEWYLARSAAALSEKDTLWASTEWGTQTLTGADDVDHELCPIEADNSQKCSNDGRVDLLGARGTMVPNDPFATLQERLVRFAGPRAVSGDR